MSSAIKESYFKALQVFSLLNQQFLHPSQTTGLVVESIHLPLTHTLREASLKLGQSQEEGPLGQIISVLMRSKWRNTFYLGSGLPATHSDRHALICCSLTRPFLDSSTRPRAGLAEGTPITACCENTLIWMTDSFWKDKGASLRHLHELIIPPDCFRDVWLCNSNCLERETEENIGKQPTIKSQTAPEAAEDGGANALSHKASTRCRNCDQLQTPQSKRRTEPSPDTTGDCNLGKPAPRIPPKEAQHIKAKVGWKGYCSHS